MGTLAYSICCSDGIGWRWNQLLQGRPIQVLRTSQRSDRFWMDYMVHPLAIIQSFVANRSIRRVFLSFALFVTILLGIRTIKRGDGYKGSLVAA